VFDTVQLGLSPVKLQLQLLYVFHVQPFPIPFPEAVNGGYGKVEGQGGKSEEHCQDHHQPFSGSYPSAHPAQTVFNPIADSIDSLSHGFIGVLPAGRGFRLSQTSPS